jgi:hypothetical protein
VIFSYTDRDKGVTTEVSGEVVVGEKMEHEADCNFVKGIQMSD